MYLRFLTIKEFKRVSKPIVLKNIHLTNQTMTLISNMNWLLIVYLNYQSHTHQITKLLISYFFSNICTSIRNITCTSNSIIKVLSLII
jgi:hypothetical protein